MSAGRGSNCDLMAASSLQEEICQAIHKQQGILFASPALVHRVMYSGRGVIAPNTKFCPDLVDSRGYLPVEWWVMSKTEAKNPEPKENEGITSLVVNGRPVLLTEALAVAEKELMGGFSSSWPLTKVLDIGGVERRPHFSEPSLTSTALPEVPPVPCHVHAGEVKEGHCVGHGKTEAYFFPPVDVPPYNLTLGPVKTRLGLRPNVTREQVLAALSQFGQTDDLYSLLNEYEIRPWETWTIEQKIVHAPGPWPTFEIQLPQDDFHFLAWHFGEQIAANNLCLSRTTYHFRGLDGEETLLNETLQWEDNVDPRFKERWWRECGVEEEGEWGRRVRLFYHIFYGEGYVIRPGRQYQRDADNKPFAGIVWSGEGRVNGLKLNCVEKGCREFLVTPHHGMLLENTSLSSDLMVFTVFPLAQVPQSS